MRHKQFHKDQKRKWLQEMGEVDEETVSSRCEENKDNNSGISSIGNSGGTSSSIGNSSSSSGTDIESLLASDYDLDEINRFLLMCEVE